MQTKKEQQKKWKGFTLIEMMMVIGIIALLTAIILPKFSNLNDKAQTQTLNAQMKAINTQIQVYHIDKGTYPTAMTVAGWGGSTVISNYWPTGAVPSPNVAGQVWTYDSTTGTVTGAH